MIKISLFTAILFSCVTFKSTFTEKSYNSKSYFLNDSLFKIYKIDSVKSFFLIYAQRGKERIKIISDKKDVPSCERIKVDNSYNFSLESIWTKSIMIGTVNVSPSETPHVTCLAFDDSTKICLERENGINDLFVSKNLKGLCFVDK